MDESILDSIKKLLGIPVEYPVFDDVIITHINTVFSVLYQIGASPVEGFFITDSSSKWQDFLVKPIESNMVKTYMYLKIRLIWETDSITANTITAIEKQIADYEFRLNIMELAWNPRAYDRPSETVAVAETPVIVETIVEPVTPTVWSLD